MLRLLLKWGTPERYLHGVVVKVRPVHLRGTVLELLLKLGTSELYFHGVAVKVGIHLRGTVLGLLLKWGAPECQIMHAEGVFRQEGSKRRV